MARRILAVLFLASMLMLGGTTYVLLKLPTRSFQAFGPATDVKAYDFNGIKIADIHDPKRITQICKFVNRYQSGWGGPADVFGVPTPAMKVDFYNGQAFMGHFGAGPGFFETQRDGDFASCKVTRNDQKAFKDLLGIP